MKDTAGLTKVSKGARSDPLTKSAGEGPFDCAQGRSAPQVRAARDHIIAVGGAGSSGLPALASGTRIITTMSTMKASIPRRSEGC
jgi:hypothetical protein